MNFNHLDELVGHFQNKISSMKLCVQLRNTSQTGNSSKLLAKMNRNVGELEAVILLLKAEISRQRDEMKQVQMMRSVVIDLNERVSHATENIPDRLPTRMNNQSNTKSMTPTASSSANVNATPLKQKDTNKSMQDTTVPKGPSIHKIEYLMIDEFESTPKYIRGRFTYDQINSAIDEFNKALTAKYTYMAKAKKNIIERTSKTYTGYKAQENKETKGFQFFVEEDVKLHTSFKLGKSRKSGVENSPVMPYCTEHDNHSKSQHDIG
ncbi:unnamed protein product [Owenia fusiformis]|uniref:SKA complex subunit 1 n=1 Tax=Owenia fusiformis TaxID=6347 RepID=A0A8S4PSH2_OWEFU|nr:unnamed protein product [Owenia fusiformis]